MKTWVSIRIIVFFFHQDIKTQVSIRIWKPGFLSGYGNLGFYQDNCFFFHQYMKTWVSIRIWKPGFRSGYETFATGQISARTLYILADKKLYFFSYFGAHKSCERSHFLSSWNIQCARQNHETNACQFRTLSLTLKTWVSIRINCFFFHQDMKTWVSIRIWKPGFLSGYGNLGFYQDNCFFFHQYMKTQVSIRIWKPGFLSGYENLGFYQDMKTWVSIRIWKPRFLSG